MSNPPERNNENPFFAKWADEKIREDLYEPQNMIVTSIA
jgi:hypothetical protein